MNNFASIYEVSYYFDNVYVTTCEVDVYLGLVEQAVSRVANQNNITYNSYKIRFLYEED